MSCSIIYQNATDSNEGRDWFIMSSAHEYAIKHYPDKYRNRKGCRSGEKKNANYYFIQAVMEAYKAGIYNESFNEDKWK